MGAARRASWHARATRHAAASWRTTGHARHAAMDGRHGPSAVSGHDAGHASPNDGKEGQEEGQKGQERQEEEEGRRRRGGGGRWSPEEAAHRRRRFLREPQRRASLGTHFFLMSIVAIGHEKFMPL